MIERLGAGSGGRAIRVLLAQRNLHAFFTFPQL